MVRWKLNVEPYHEFVFREADRLFANVAGSYNMEPLETESLLVPLIEETKNCDPAKLVEHFLIRHGENSWVYNELDQDQTGLSGRAIFFFLGFLTSENFEPGDEEPDYVSIEKELIRVFETLSYEQIEGISISMQMRGRMLWAGDFTSTYQYLRSIKRKYRAHDALMKDELGFSSEDLVEFMRTCWVKMGENSADDGIIEFFFDRAYEYLEYVDFVVNASSEEFYNSDYPHFKSIRYSFLLAKQQYLDQMEEGFVYSREEVVNSTDLPRETAENILDRISIKIPNNREFNSPFEFNPLEEKPVIEIEDEIYIPPMYLVLRSLDRTFYYDLCFNEDDSYRGRVGNKWGEYLEEWAGEILGRKTDVVYRNLKPDGDQANGEIDVAAVIDEKLVIGECKSKSMSVDSRDGDRESLREDLKQGVIRGINQLDNVFSDLSSNEYQRLSNSSERIDVQDFQEEDIVPIVVLGSAYDQISVSGFKEEVEDSKSDPWVVDIHSFDLITEFSNNSQLLDYIKFRRKILSSGGDLTAQEELDLFGSFRYGNLSWMPENLMLEMAQDDFTTMSFGNGAALILSQVDEIERLSKELGLDTGNVYE